MRNLLSLSSFSNVLRRNLNKLYYENPEKDFYHGYRMGNTIHCQLRNKASSLNVALCNNSISNNCGFHVKNAIHVLFNVLNLFRKNTLFHCIANLGIQKPITLDLLLSGDNDISYADNIALFNFVPLNIYP